MRKSASEQDLDAEIEEIGIHRVQVLGGLGCILLLVLPVWDAILLLEDPTIRAMIGKGIPIGMLIACGALLFIYLITQLCFWACAPESERRRAVVLTMLWVFLSLMGASLVLMSLPIGFVANDAYSEALNRCGTGPYTRELTDSYNQLSAVRQTSSCSNQDSVEACMDLGNPNVSAGIRWKALKTMESHFRCSGFCTPLSASSTTGYVEYPLPLFSQSHLAGSCSGAAGRQMKFLLGGLSHQLFWQGVAMVGVCVVLGFASLTVDMKRGRDTYFRTLLGGAKPRGSGIGRGPPATYGTVPERRGPYV